MVTFRSTRSANFWIKALQLIKHPEGGFYRETHRADITTDFCAEEMNKLQNGSPDHKGRSIASTIYYMLKGTQVSLFHRMRHADEIWHFYTGSSDFIFDRKKWREIVGIETRGRTSKRRIVSNPNKTRFVVWR